MQLVRSTPAPPSKPCMRDTADLVARLAPVAEVIKAIPLKHVRRRLQEIAAEEPRFTEEWPLVLDYERRRRRRVAQPLYLD